MRLGYKRRSTGYLVHALREMGPQARTSSAEFKTRCFKVTSRRSRRGRDNIFKWFPGRFAERAFSLLFFLRSVRGTRQILAMDTRQTESRSLISRIITCVPTLYLALEFRGTESGASDLGVEWFIDGRFSVKNIFHLKISSLLDNIESYS